MVLAIGILFFCYFSFLWRWLMVLTQDSADRGGSGPNTVSAFQTRVSNQLESTVATNLNNYLVSYGDGVDNGGDGCNQPETLVVVDLMWRHIYKYSFTCPLKKLSDFLPEIPPFGITWD